MLDLHAIKVTPGAATTLGSAGSVVAGNDGAPVAGVPINPLATLVLWGGSSIVADTIANMKLVSQDQVDPINGELMTLGTASLQNLAYKTTKLDYKKGNRQISMGTNTGVTGGLGYTLDYYQGGPVADAKGMYFPENNILIPQTLGADVAVTWVQTGFAPTNPIPNGKYALLGAYVTVTTGGHGIRFAHADFQGFKPGFLAVDQPASAILGWQEGQKDILAANQGYQFVKLSEMIGKPCIPIFTVSNAATGLQIESVAAATNDTPVIILNLAQVG